MSTGRTIRLNFSTRQHSHCHDVELVSHNDYSLVIRARSDIPLGGDRVLPAGHCAWLRNPMMPNGELGEEVLTQPGSLVVLRHGVVR